ncbi:FAD-binding oxidoreductase [Streptomyces sp. KS 21]|uniref:FAD-binding oxidoreductase n=1 Tax=Streptomyces sp. KS 21 TaxID=2485150 RepID=UPI00106404E4|nr:FAD-binding oxidoreductase [Streptomyces sp. KS 21]TDU74549.1 FAD/FMN-containing dehydrogenase [Streptomyces sp. KS 21]
MNGVSEADWQRLEKTVAGRVRRPGDAGFRESSTPFNARYAATTPNGVVTAANHGDVRHAVEWARDTGVRLVARSGGHSYAGHSVNTGLVLDLSALNAVVADGSTGLVTAAGGARMADVYAAIQPHGMAFALGNGASVGIAGLTLGGGSSSTSRKLGLTADALVRTTLMTAGGEVLTCDAQENPDLYWACRGGGGGNFGINLSFTFQATAVPDVSTCLLLWDGAHAPEVFAAVQEATRHAPDEFSLRLGVAAADGDPVVSAVGLHLGPASELRELLAPVLATTRPVREDIADRTFWEAKDYLLHETSAGAFAVRTNFAAEPLPPEAVAAVMSRLARRPGSRNPDGCGLALYTWGGAINRVAPADTAFVHRDARFLVSMDTSWTEEDGPDTVEANLHWLAGLQEEVAPYAGRGAYQNFIDPDLPDWRTAYYGANYLRLVEIKKRVDPDGFFTFGQAIGS